MIDSGLKISQSRNPITPARATTKKIIGNKDKLITLLYRIKSNFIKKLVMMPLELWCFRFYIL